MRLAIVLMGHSIPADPALIVPTERPVILGRSTQCDIVLDHTSVSRRHARLTPSGALRVRVLDLGSRNGTFVDDTRISEAVVVCGQHVRFGGVTLHLCEESAAPEGTDSSLDGDIAARGEWEQTSMPGAPGLTNAQREVFGLLVQGLPEKTVAKRLGVSIHTAHNHICAIYKALCVHSRAELMAFVLRERQGGGRLAPPPANERLRPWQSADTREAGLKLYYSSPVCRDFYRHVLNHHGIAYSDPGAFIQLDTPVTPEVMRVLSATVLNAFG
jgi:DNA-binding CsgD family transcriptional regulator